MFFMGLFDVAANESFLVGAQGVRERIKSVQGPHQECARSAQGVGPERTRSGPGAHQEWAKSAPGMGQERARSGPGAHQE